MVRQLARRCPAAPLATVVMYREPRQADIPPCAEEFSCKRPVGCQRAGPRALTVGRPLTCRGCRVVGGFSSLGFGALSGASGSVPRHWQRSAVVLVDKSASESRPIPLLSIAWRAGIRAVVQTLRPWTASWLSHRALGGAPGKLRRATSGRAYVSI